MNQEFIDAYPEGIALSAAQRSFITTESTTLYHQVELTFNAVYQESEIQQHLAGLCSAHFSLTANYKPIQGYKGIRQFPVINDSSILVEHIINEASIHNTQLLLTHPVDISLEKGKTLQVILITQSDNTQSLILRIAAIVADMNSLLSLGNSLSESLIDMYADDEFLQYPQYLEWQQETLDSEYGVEGKAYWQQYFSGIDRALYSSHLPYRLPVELNGQQSVLSISAEIPESTLLSLQHNANKLELSVTDLLQATWWLVVSKLIGENGFIGGYAYDPRLEFEELAGALGVYQQVLPIKIEHQNDDTLSDWLKKTIETSTQHTQWTESLSEEGVVEEIHIGFNQSLFINNNSIQLINAQMNLANFELLMDVSHSDNNAFAQLNYVSSVYSKQAIETLLNQYLHVLSLLETSLIHTIENVSLVSAKEEQRLLNINTPDKASQAPVHLIERIYSHAKNNGNNVALHCLGEQLNYKELTVEVDKVANWLSTKNVTQGDYVALCLPRSINLIVSLLAVMRIGASYIPVDPSWPEERQNIIYQNALPKLVLHEQKNSTINNAVNITSAIEQASQLTSNAAAFINDLTSTAYIVYTSGSTGTPKGVVIEHQQLSQYCAAITQAVSLDVNINFALTSTVAADLGNTTLFGALYNCAALHIATDSELKDGVAFQQFLINNKVDCLKIVPTHLQALLDGTPKYLPQKVILGGEACSPHLLTKLYELSPNLSVFNHYGPSETTVGVMVHTYQLSKNIHQLVPKLSNVLNGSEVIILNNLGQLCGIGELGQLYIGGKQLAQGYLGQPDNNAFCQLSHFNGRWYASGDTARYLPDNSISITGRSDDQIKVRGFRIEPAEVELAVAHELNSDSALAQLVMQGNKTQLITYVHSSELPQGLLGKQEYTSVIEKLRTKLTEAMLPQHIIIVSTWPLLANGKLNKKALPPLNSFVNDEYIAATTPLQKLLSNTMTDLLTLDKISTTSSFFDLGADSLMVIRFVTRIRKLLLVDIEPGLIFDNASIVELEKALENQSADVNKLHKLAQTQLTLASLSPEQQTALRNKFSSQK